MRISIKRRLFISNILMVVIPVALTFAMLVSALLIIVGDFGLEEITSVPDIPIEQVSSLNVDFSAMDMQVEESVLVYQLESGNYVLFLPEQMNDQFENVYWQDTQLRTDIAIISEELIERLAFFEEQTLMNIIFSLTLVIFIFLANHFLTRFVFKPIITSLNVLTEGVHEISAGNLSYRLKHDMGNEFDIVGANFNEMATRLHEMVEQRKEDDQNRKELIAGISHDLRTPLTSIRTYAEGIELGLATTPEKQEKYISTIKNRTKDIEHIINQLFLFSKLDIGDFPMRLDKRNAASWLTDFVDTIEEEYSKKGLCINLDNRIKEEYFLVDSVQLKNVLNNILENSVKYGKKPDGIMKIECVRDREDIIITMTDNGLGVPDEDLNKLFDVFYRSDKARSNPSGGSGLGLAISAKMIERMGGCVSATNANDGGLQIILKLPFVKGEI